jgi:hypothetical protein
LIDETVEALAEGSAVEDDFACTALEVTVDAGKMARRSGDHAVSAGTRSSVPSVTSQTR